MKQSGIYKIVNKINGKPYVGSSTYLANRWVRHKWQLKKNIHHSTRLQNAWNKYGEDVFEFKILEIIKNPTKKKLEEREQYWIDFYKSYLPEAGYNILQQAGSPLGVRLPSTIKFKKDILKFIKKNKYLPSPVNGTKKERKLGKVLGEYITQDCKQYDPIFTKKLNMYPNWLEFRSYKLKQDILDFCRKHGYKPSLTSINKLEYDLGHRSWAHSNKSSQCYDKVFSLKFNKYPTYQEWYKNKLKQDIFDFVEINKHLPSRMSKNKNEIHLYEYIKHLRNKNKTSYDNEFDRKISKFLTWQQFKTL